MKKGRDESLDKFQGQRYFQEVHGSALFIISLVGEMVNIKKKNYVQIFSQVEAQEEGMCTFPF